MYYTHEGSHDTDTMCDVGCCVSGTLVDWSAASVPGVPCYVEECRSARGVPCRSYHLVKPSSVLCSRFHIWCGLWPKGSKWSVGCSSHVVVYIVEGPPDSCTILFELSTFDE